MPMTRKFGAALAAVGIAVAGTPFLATAAQAEVVTPQAYIMFPDTSTVLGGQFMLIEGENLWGVKRVTFGDVEAEILQVVSDNYVPDGVDVAVIVPAHEVGTVPVTVYLDPNSPELPVGETVVTQPVRTSSSAPTVTSTTVTSTTGPIDETDATASEESPTFSTSTSPPVAFAADTSASGTTEQTDPTTAYETVTSTVTSSYGPVDLVDGLVPVYAGDFSYIDVWTQALSPSKGSTLGGTEVVIEDPFLDDVFMGTCFIDDFDMSGANVQALADRKTRLEGFGQDFPMEVYFGDEPGIDAKLVLSDDFELSITVTTPEHVAGDVDVTAVFRNAECQWGPEEGVALAAAPRLKAGDLAVTRKAGFTYVDGAVETSAVTSVAESAGSSSSEAGTPVVTTSDSPAAPSTSATAPMLSSTGVSSATGVTAVVGLALLASGLGVLGMSRRTRRQH